MTKTQAMSKVKYIASCSGGKDSVATILLAKEFREPLDEIVYCEVMFDRNTSGEVPEHRDFIYHQLKPFCENTMGCRFTVLRSVKTYDEVFHRKVVRGPSAGMARGFVLPGKCFVNRDCKIPTIEKYTASFSADTVSYIGIASDEPKRLARLNALRQISLLEKYGCTESDAIKLCRKYDLLSPIYRFTRRNGCWFCLNMRQSEQKHLVLNHPELLDKLIEWEKEDHLYCRRLTRHETPSELRTRILRENEQTELSVNRCCPNG